LPHRHLRLPSWLKGAASPRRRTSGEERREGERMRKRGGQKEGNVRERGIAPWLLVGLDASAYLSYSFIIVHTITYDEIQYDRQRHLSQLISQNKSPYLLPLLNFSIHSFSISFPLPHPLRSQ